MGGMKRDENGVVLPVRSLPADAEKAGKLAFKKNAAKTQQKDEKSSENAAESKKPIGHDEISKARAKLIEYMQNKKAYDVRLKKNFDTYNLMYTESDLPQFTKDSNGEVHKTVIPVKRGAQTLNIVLNKHADAMDNYPEAVCLPRSKDDEETAQLLNSVLPCVLERNGFMTTYSDCMTDKFVGGVGVYAVTWDPNKDGLGDIVINRVDVLSLFWEPFVNDIEDSPNVFCVKQMDIEEAKSVYPELKEAAAEGTLGLEEYRTYDSTNKQHNKADIIDWYYKADGKLHLARFCGEVLLFASENEPELYKDGFYAHGEYPFEFDPYLKLRNTPVGFGLVDICRAPQNALDELKRDILKNVRVNSQTRQLVENGSGINIDDLADLDKDFVEASDINNAMRPFETKDIASGALSMYNALIEEMKDTTGTNDPSNGASAAGVTSGTAIAALQEAGGKISRDSNKQTYQTFVRICNKVIELMRQFYTLPRLFRIVGEDKQTEYKEFDNSGLRVQSVEVDGLDEPLQRKPVFDIKVKAQKSSPFMVAANNQMMMDMYGAGMFAPGNAEAALIALEGMSFEGKDKIIEMIRKNQSLEKKVKDLSERLQMTEAMMNNMTAQNTQDAAMVPPPAEAGTMVA